MHCETSSFGIALSQRLKDSGVLWNCSFASFAFVGHKDPNLPVELANAAHERDEKFIARRPVNDVVEADVCLDERLDLIHVCAQLVNRLFEAIEVAIWDPWSGPSDRPHLEDHAHVEELQGRFSICVEEELQRARE